MGDALDNAWLSARQGFADSLEPRIYLEWGTGVGHHEDVPLLYVVYREQLGCCISVFWVCEQAFDPVDDDVWVPSSP